MSDLTGVNPFQFEGRNVRLVDRDGKTWCVASDVARELGFRDAANLIRMLDDDEKGRHSVPTHEGYAQSAYPLDNGGTHNLSTPSDQEMSIISEPGLYRAIIQRRANKKHDASLTAKIERFQRWVFHDILPSIRKTGGYGGNSLDVRDPKQLAHVTLQLIEVMKEKDEAIRVMEPKANFFDKFAEADGLYGLQNAARVLNQPPNKFIGYLKRQHLFYQGGALVPKAQYREAGLFEVKCQLVDDKARHQTFVTPRGIEHFAEKLNGGSLFSR